MSWRVYKTAAGVLLACVPLAGSGVLPVKAMAAPPPALPANQAQPQERPSEVSPAAFARLRALIRPHPDEARCRWLTDIPWETGLWEARQKAAAQGKPLLVVGSGGGSPLGRC